MYTAIVHGPCVIYNDGYMYSYYCMIKKKKKLYDYFGGFMGYLYHIRNKIIILTPVYYYVNVQLPAQTPGRQHQLITPPYVKGKKFK